MKVRVLVGAPVKDMAKRLKGVSICTEHKSCLAGNLQTHVFLMGARTHQRVAVAGGSVPEEGAGCSVHRRREVRVQPIIGGQRDSVSLDGFDIAESEP
jgi:hypothetical protein